MSKQLQDALQAIEARFTSANKIPVSQATVPASEWRALRQALADVEEAQPHDATLVSLIYEGIMSTPNGHRPRSVEEFERASERVADMLARRKAQPLTDEQTLADAARWREMRRVFHVTENIGRSTGMPATKLSCHWHGWCTGDHADVTACVDALIAERAHGITTACPQCGTVDGHKLQCGERADGQIKLNARGEA